MKPLCGVPETPNLSEDDVSPAFFETVDDLIRYLKGLGVDESAFSIGHGVLVFHEKPTCLMTYTQSYDDNERGIKKGVIVLTQQGMRIVSEIKTGTFRPAPEPDSNSPQTLHALLSEIQRKLSRNPWLSYNPEIGSEKDELMEDERKGILRKIDHRYFLELDDGTLLPLSEIAIVELQQIAGGIDRNLGKTIEVRVDDSQSPPVVIEIYFEGE